MKLVSFCVRLVGCLTLALVANAASVCEAIGRFPGDESFLNLWGRAKSEALPFDLPETLPGGGVKMFHRAESHTAYEYSQGGRVLVYRYDQAEVAADDFAMFAKANEKLDDKTSAVLARLNACVMKQPDTATLWVALDDSIVGFQLPADKWSAPAVAKSAEEIVRAETDRLTALFGAPERVLSTYFKAVGKADGSQIMRCMTAGGDPEARKRLGQVSGMMPMLQIAMMEGMGMRGGAGQDGAQPQIGRAEKTGDGRVFVPVRVGEAGRNELVWLGLLQFAAGLERLNQMMQMPQQGRGNEPLWIPVKQIGNRWAIDLHTLGLARFAKLVPTREDREKMSTRAEALVKAREILNQARQIDAAIDQWALETGQMQDAKVDLKQIAAYLREGAVQRALAAGNIPNDALGNPYLIGPVGPNQIRIHPATKKALEDSVTDWGPY